MTHYDLIVLNKIFQRDSTDLLTRSYGRKAFKILERQLKDVRVGDILVLDAGKISLIDTSFADEALLGLFDKLQHGKYGDRYIALASPSADTSDNIEGALTRRRLKFPFPTITSDNNIELVGALEPNLRETFEVLVRARKLTARDLADKLRISIYNASNRLRRLHEIRLAIRSRDSADAVTVRSYLPLV